MVFARGVRMLRVQIVEDYEVSRLGLRLMLERQPGFEVVADSEDGASAIAQYEEHLPDVVVMDLQLRDERAADTTILMKQRWSDVRILILTAHDEDEDIFEAFSAGADGYCVKEVPTAELCFAIQVVADGGTWIDPRIAGRVLNIWTKHPEWRNSAKLGFGKNGPELTSRELDILRLVVEGKRNNIIAQELAVTEETVKTYVKRLLSKLAVNDRTQAAVKAIRENLI